MNMNKLEKHAVQRFEDLCKEAHPRLRGAEAKYEIDTWANETTMTNVMLSRRGDEWEDDHTVGARRCPPPTHAHHHHHHQHTHPCTVPGASCLHFCGRGG
jgi:hypothetical protein